MWRKYDNSKRIRTPQAALLAGMLVLTAACGPTPRSTSPSQFVNLSDERAHYTFDDSTTTWETFTAEGNEALFQVIDGALLGAVVPNKGYLWSLSGTRYSNAAIQATVQQIKGLSGNGFGVMCRADAAGNGYYFLISSAGQFAILKGSPRRIDPEPLVEWQPSDAINLDMAENQLLAICTGDYLSFSVNRQFLAEARDDEYAAGEIGMVLGAVGEAAWVTFDDIVVRNATIIGVR
ncbi:MAG: hypothetical protein H6672_05215 [Anaerolineaceae bacterium]|nr:hypothetical protein [Anaerolineaceae bacterium]